MIKWNIYKRKQKSRTVKKEKKKKPEKKPIEKEQTALPLCFNTFIPCIDTF
jgi:hypothetical protein